MRALTRGPAPACLATDTPAAEATHRGRYDDLRYPSGKIRPLWNDLDKDARGVGAVRRALLAMSEDECAFCGRWVGNDHMQVDHLLPQEAFPFLAYAWENLLPTCDVCNRRKLMFVPARLRGRVIVDVCLRGPREYDLLFDKAHLFHEVAADHRLVDPSFDTPEDHLEVVLDVPTYRPKTALGSVTYTRLFIRREITAHLDKIREAARVGIEGTCSDEGIEAFATVCGYPSLFRRFVAYSKTTTGRPTRLRPAFPLSRDAAQPARRARLPHRIHRSTFPAPRTDAPRARRASLRSREVRACPRSCAPATAVTTTRSSPPSAPWARPSSTSRASAPASPAS